MVLDRNRSPSASPSRSPPPRERSPTKEGGKGLIVQGKNFVEGGADENPLLLALIITGPLLTQLLAYLTSQEMFKHTPEPYLSNLAPACLADLTACGLAVLLSYIALHVTLNGTHLRIGFVVNDV